MMSGLPPLVALNPMAKDHVASLIDDLLALDAEEVARQAIEDSALQHADLPNQFSIGPVIADDQGGVGWTNRYASEFSLITGESGSSPFRNAWLAGALVERAGFRRAGPGNRANDGASNRLHPTTWKRCHPSRFHDPGGGRHVLLRLRCTRPRCR